MTVFEWVNGLAVVVARLFRQLRDRRIENNKGASDVPVIVDNRGVGRMLLDDDFGPGRIDQLSRDDFRSGWMNVSALSAYRLNQFLKNLPRGVRWQLTSAWRSAARNAADGGARDSRHLVGMAFDVFLFDQEFFRRIAFYVDLARRVGFQGVGLYQGKTLIHMDNRSQRAGWAKTVVDGETRYISLASAIRQFTVPGGGTAVAAVITVAAANYIFFG